MDFSETDDDFVPNVDVYPMRQILLKEMRIRNQFLSIEFLDVEWNKKNPSLKIINQVQPCNFISSVLYAFSSVKCFRKILNQIYIHCLDSIDSRGTLPVSSLIFFFSRAMFHLKMETMTDEIFLSLVRSVQSNLSNYMTYDLVNISVEESDPGLLLGDDRKHPLRDQIYEV
jgi:hypothetical protein